MTKPGALHTFTRVNVSLAVILLIQGNAFASDDDRQREKGPEGIVGVWESTATVRDCNNGVAITSFKGLSTFNVGGTASYGSNSPPALTSASMGTWRRESRRTYSITLVFYRFSPDGALVGMQKSKGTRTLSEDENSFTGAVNGQITDAAGNILAHTCLTDTGSRVSW
ncbi:hypothetical protein [Variovorax sp. J31P207]|uniref:hypothetical protein n=1 Tax=Variovorax sp. J31P207 TaxID=3053510 RepID=UPI002575FC4F|nr:hypothetical protein [Variovorax sp. J31P207]MDM0064965.1 hypothetical protein [Variovorax sp. J31P207]